MENLWINLTKEKEKMKVENTTGCYTFLETFKLSIIKTLHAERHFVMHDDINKAATSDLCLSSTRLNG